MPPSRAGRGIALLVSIFLCVLGCCHGQSPVSISPVAMQTVILDHLGGDQFSPQWLNVTCTESGFTRGMFNWTRNAIAIDETAGHIIEDNVLYFRVHHIHATLQTLECVTEDVDTGSVEMASVDFISAERPPVPASVTEVSITPNAASFNVATTPLRTADKLLVRYGPDGAGQAQQQTVNYTLSGSTQLVSLPGLTPGTAYTMHVSYRNSASGAQSAQRTESFTTRQVPARPSNLVLGSIVHDSAVASWDALMDAMWQDNGVSSPSRQYRVVLVNAAKPHSSITAATSMTLTGLDPSTTYTVQLTATNNFGEGLALEEDFTTLSAPRLSVTETPLSTLSPLVFKTNVSFSPPADWLNNGALAVSYKYSLDGNRTFDQTTQPSFNIQYGGGVEIFISATPVVNGQAYPEYSGVLVKTSGIRQPPQPVVSDITTTATTIMVTWEPIDFNDGGPGPAFVRTFTIELRFADSGAEVLPTPAVDHTALAYTFRNLSPNRKYVVRLNVANNQFDTEVNKDATTNKKEPSDSVSITSLVPGTHSLALSWTAISNWNSDDGRNYRLNWYCGNLSTQPIMIPPHNTTFVIENLKPHTQCNVSIAAVNDIGSGPISYTITSTKEAAPSKVRDLNKSQSDHTAVTVTWREPEYPNGIVQHYNVTLEDDVTGSVRSLVTQDLMATFNGLIGGMQYHVSVRAFTVEYSNPSTITFQSIDGTPSDPPRIQTVKVDVGLRNALKVTWRNPAETHGDIVSYMFFLTPTGGAEETRTIPQRGVEQCQTCPFGALRVALTGLEYDTEYTIRMAVLTSVGASPTSLPSNPTSTIQGEPTAPRNLTFSQVNATSVFLQWQPPTNAFAQTWQYTVEYVEAQGTKKSLTVDHVHDEQQLQQHSLSALIPYTQYSVHVVTYNGLFRSNDSVSTSFMTSQAAPETPSNVQSTCPALRTSPASFSWTEPTKLNGPAVVYSVYITTTDSDDEEYVDSEGADNLLTTSWQPSRPLQPFTKYALTVTAKQRDDPLLASRMLIENVECKSSTIVPRPPTKPPAFRGSGNIASNGSIPLELTRSPDHAFAAQYAVYVRKSTPGSRQQRSVLGRFRRQADSTEYVTARLAPDSVADGTVFVIGDGKTHGVANAPLVRGFSYEFALITVTASGTESEKVWTPKVDFSAPDDTSSGLVLIVAAAIGAVVVLLLVVLLIVVILRYRGRRRTESTGAASTNNSTGKKPFTLPKTGDETVEKIRLGEDKAHPAIHLAEFSEHVVNMRAEGNLPFSQEYDSLPLHFEGFTTNNSDLTVNHQKNRYTNIKAYDHSRVRLNAIKGVSGSDYINANFVDGHDEKNAYIATQGPVDETKADFWRMVWEQQSATIVMLTNLEEKGKPKCAQYWPDSGTIAYGNIEVTLTDTIPLADYVVRVFNLVKVGRDEPSREVKQFQFTAWPDQSAPRHATPMLLFRRKVRQLNPERSGPMIVHCSAGIGRTGTFIAIDAMLKRAEELDTLDVYGYCTIMRAQRNFMVQVEEQYFFIHEAIKESLDCGNTEIYAKDLPQALQRLRQPSILDDSITGMQAEFQRLSTEKVDNLSFLAALRDCNVKKNRFADELYLPFDEYRVRLPLSSMKGEEGGDYVNASYVDGYKSHCAFVAAQSPMARTVDAFWQMVWQSGSKVIVMLTDVIEDGQETCHQYWPVDMASQYGTCLVDPISEQTKTDASQQVVYTLRQFKMTNTMGDATRTVCLFQYSGSGCWPRENSMDSDQTCLATGRRSLIDLIGEVQKLQERTDDHSPVVIHCDTGVGRTGCFIALSTIIERMRCEGLLDVFMTIKSLRAHRPFLVRTLAEYSFVYDTVLEYLAPFDHFTDVMDTDGDAVAHSRYSVDVAV
ncbi:receptor-type tyrosine-protein phosphatase S-like isoform X2 [Sycon ciliatum]|uniref:receptor-type tyrosine-protein phosphatase S-like isoform X2 n=1 Tax=Sycon ciliatum TaxID=27933 RepID=UPI0020AA0E4A|eukprot:scpid6024/ scgid16442/ Receptor-type tyrosine-protein phosphatase delta